MIFRYYANPSAEVLWLDGGNRSLPLQGCAVQSARPGMPTLNSDFQERNAEYIILWGEVGVREYHTRPEQKHTHNNTHAALASNMRVLFACIQAR